MTESTLESIARAQDRTILIVQQLVKTVDERIEHDDLWRERTDLIIFGDGNGRKGHNVRLDRLEVAADRQRWLIRLMGGAVAVALIKGALDIIAP